MTAAFVVLALLLVGVAVFPVLIFLASRYAWNETRRKWVKL